jgi:hypothetical protein
MEGVGAMQEDNEEVIPVTTTESGPSLLAVLGFYGFPQVKDFVEWCGVEYLDNIRREDQH